MQKFFIKHFSKEIWLVALFGLLLSASTQMLYSHLALFLSFNLKASVLDIAKIDGFVEFLSYFVRIFSGAISDYLYNRKLLLIVGCSIAMLVKPIFALANSTLAVIIAEISERLGCGIQASPRDALIADLSNRKELGSSFGFCKALKTTGGVIGSSVAVLIVYLSDNNYQLLFFLSTIPVLLAILCIVKIHNPKQSLSITTDDERKFDNPFQKKYLKSLDRKFWTLILLAFLCELAHFGESLLTIKASQLFSQTFSGTVSIVAAIGQVIFAYFIGIASDKLKKFNLLRLNLVLLLISYFIMNNAASIYTYLIGIFIFYGQFAVIQLLFLALINNNICPKLRGTAIGVFYFVIGISYLTTTYFCGFLCKNFGYNPAFIYVSIQAFIALTAVCFIKSKQYE